MLLYGGFVNFELFSHNTNNLTPNSKVAALIWRYVNQQALAVGRGETTMQENSTSPSQHFDPLRTDSLNKTCYRSGTDSPLIDYQITYFCLYCASLLCLSASGGQKTNEPSWQTHPAQANYGRRAQLTPESQPPTRGLRFNVNTL